MSRTDKAAPAYPRRGPGFRRNWVRPRNKAARKRARMALHRGEQPEPSRPRHSALWDAG